MTAQSHRLDAEFFEPRYGLLEKVISSAAWPVAQLNDLVEPIKNGFDFREFVAEGTPYIRVGDVWNGLIDVEQAQRVPLSPQQMRKNVHLQPGDVLFTRKGSYGNTAVVRPGQENSIISSEIMLLRLKDERVEPEYLSAYLNSTVGQLQVERRVHGDAFFSISQSDLGSISIPIAPSTLQRRIRQVL